MLKYFAALGLAVAVVGCDSDDPVAPVPGPASIYVVHGINGTDLGAAEALPVDISVNGACLVQGFTFRTIAGPLALPAGDYDIEIFSPASAATPCSGTSVIQQGVTVSAEINATIVAHLNLVGAPIASVFVNDVSDLSALFARHTAQFGPVDVVVNPGAGEVRLDSLEIGREAGAGGLPAGMYRVTIAPAGQATTVFDQMLQVQAGRYYTGYAVGTPSNGTFEVLLQEIDPSAVPTPLP